MNRQKREDFKRRAIEAEGKLKLLQDELAIRRDHFLMLSGKYERIRFEHDRINELVLRVMTPDEQSRVGLSHDVEKIVDELAVFLRNAEDSSSKA